MAITEIFRNPTVKQVIFQIQYPNLFYIEKMIGDFQVKIMEQFPESALILRKGLHISFGSAGQISPDVEDEGGAKIWQFTSANNVKLSLQTNSLDIVSEHHKTYTLGDGEKFRDVIKFSLDCFFELVPVPIINRIGLRYIDHCPIIKKNNRTFLEYYNTSFPLDRFSLEDADNIDFRARVKRGEYFLTYRETLKKIDEEFILVLDFDGFALKVKPADYLSITDELHTLISNEFNATAKEPLKEYMRK